MFTLRAALHHFWALRSGKPLLIVLDLFLNPCRDYALGLNSDTAFFCLACRLLFFNDLSTFEVLMSAISVSSHQLPKSCDLYPLDSEMVELSLLLPAWQAHELEKEADERGLTAGQMLRQALRDFMARLQCEPRESWE